MAEQKTFGLNDYGFTVPSLDTLISETKSTLISTFGETFNTQTDSVADKLTTIFNEREYQLILLAAAVYAAGTRAGAEGIYLDELLGRRGIYRRGKTKASGTVQMVIDNTAPYSTELSVEDYSFDDGNFELTSDMSIKGRIVGQVIKSSDLSVGDYVFSIVNLSDGSTQTLTLSLDSTVVNSSSLNNFFYQIKQFIVDNTVLINNDLIFIDSQEGAIYIGYGSDKVFKGLNSRVDFESKPIVGTRVVSLDLIAEEAGSLSRDAGTVISVSPKPEGFISLNNLVDFTDGNDVETDNEYKLRAESITTGSAKATRPAVITALLGISGVQRVKIFVNSTGTEDQNGVPPYRFETVVYGGTTEEISEVLYDTIAASNNTFGNVYYDVPTEDGQVERIYHTKATPVQLEIKVRYAGKTLTATEQARVASNIKNVIDSLNISDPAYNIQLISAVGSSLEVGRFTRLVIQVKKSGEPDSSYTSEDIVPSTREILTFDEDDISFERIV